MANWSSKAEIRGGRRETWTGEVKVPNMGRAREAGCGRRLWSVGVSHTLVISLSVDGVTFFQGEKKLQIKLQNPNKD